MSSEEVRAIAEVIRASGGLGRYLGGVIGSIPHDTLGLLVGDWLHEKRVRNLAKLQVTTAEMLSRVNPERLTEPNPAVIVPLLQSAADESTEGLQALWAALFANSMIDSGHNVRRAFISTLKAIDPIDARILAMVYNIPVSGYVSPQEMASIRTMKLLPGQNSPFVYIDTPEHRKIGQDNRILEREIEEYQKRFNVELNIAGITHEEYLWSAQQLYRVHCVKEVKYETEILELTDFGTSLIQACVVDTT